MKQPNWGSEVVMRQRKMENINIDDVLEIAREHNIFLVATTELTECDDDEVEVWTKNKLTGVSNDGEEEEMTDKTTNI